MEHGLPRVADTKNSAAYQKTIILLNEMLDIFLRSGQMGFRDQDKNGWINQGELSMRCHEVDYEILGSEMQL
ncbi:MAG: hypothetical protein KZQ79_12840, partial [Candidatus Thiodiazotropha sp. (ex Lucinoma borealis)]|nr:hypothetical protein [Candidatus Thiodiazotropha sp. (ex Lucinoma borealis)]